MSKKMILTIGLQGSGKSTWAKQMVQDHPGDYKRVNRDLLREMLDNGRFNDGNERFVQEIRDKVILEALKSGRNVIVDDTNLSSKHFNHIESLIRGRGEIEVVFFDIPIEECIRRDGLRDNPVGEKVIRGVEGAFLKQKEGLGKLKCKVTIIGMDDKKNNETPIVPYDLELPECVIFDCDGTLSLMNGKRNPFEYEKCLVDDLNAPIAHLARTYYKDGIKLIIVSGRDASCRQLTEQWLVSKSVPYDELYMRPEGDCRKDSIIKNEIYLEHIKGKYNVLYWVDDRRQVVQWIRSIGITCLQCADGNF